MRKYVSTFWPLYWIAAVLVVTVSMAASRAVTVLAESSPISRENVIIIDAGHGGEDGGATSCTGILESQFNLEIALRLNDLMHLLGLKTIMIRTTDISVYTQGSTIAAKKISDLKERVRIVNETENAFLVSIHQNIFADSQYHGAQVFYNEESKYMAERLQTTLVTALNPGSRRKSKSASGVYLMQHIQRPGLLVECGFLSNPEEEGKLRTGEYQKKLCCVIAATISKNLYNT